MRNISAGRNLFVVFLCWVGLLTAFDSSHSLACLQVNAEGTAGASGKDPVSQKALPPLITAEELAKLVDSKTEGVKILEPGADLQQFAQGHLPKAQFLHWVDDMTDPAERAKYNVPKAKQFSELMSRLGIKNSDHIVIYDRLSSRLSTRLFWTLKTLGHAQVQVLDGGFDAGKAKFDLSKKTIDAVPTEYNITALKDSIAATKDKLIADMDLVKKKLRDPNCRLIDGRPEEQFTGEEAGAVFHTNKPHSRKGHIPGAKNVFWKDNFNPDGTFKSAEKLKALYRSAGILPENDVITYCNEGLHAAPPWFVLTQLLDHKNVRLYDSSMAEWAESEQPMETLLPANK